MPPGSLTEDKGKRMVDGNNADAENRGALEQCQESHFAIVKVLLDLIDAGVLQVIDGK